MKNLFQDLQNNLPEELIETVIENNHVRIERIVSTGQTSPSDFWYDQEEAEWVIVLKGEAKILFEGEENPLHLKSGDHINIPAHKKHRVEWTSTEEPTIWLAVFYKE